MNDKYEVVPGLWIGSKNGDLHRERQIRKNTNQRNYRRINSNAHG